jgi:hypothetical protein
LYVRRRWNFQDYMIRLLQKHSPTTRYAAKLSSTMQTPRHATTEKHNSIGLSLPCPYHSWCAALNSAEGVKAAVAQGFGGTAMVIAAPWTLV